MHSTVIIPTISIVQTGLATGFVFGTSVIIRTIAGLACEGPLLVPRSQPVSARESIRPGITCLYYCCAAFFVLFCFSFTVGILYRAELFSSHKLTIGLLTFYDRSQNLNSFKGTDFCFYICKLCSFFILHTDFYRILFR